MRQQRTFKVFIASPNDVRHLREVVKQEIEEWDRNTKNYDIRFDDWAWEDDAVHDYYANGPQPSIDQHIAASDAFVGIFGPSLGSSLPGGESGTQHEVRIALAARQGGSIPRVMVRFPDTPSEPETEEDKARWADVVRFRDEIQSQVLYIPYGDVVALQRKVRQQLANLLFDTILEQAEEGTESAPLAWTASAEPVMGRSEGVTELMGRVSVVFTGGMPRSAAGAVQEIDLELRVTANVTNRLAEDGLTDVRLLVYDGKGTSVRYAVPGRLTSDDCIRFERVPLDLPGPHGRRRLEIVNLRANVQSRGDYATIYGQVEVRPAIHEGLQLLSVNNLVVLADTQPALRPSVSSSVFSREVGANTGLIRGEAKASFNTVLTFREGFSGAFRTLRQEAGWDTAIGGRASLGVTAGTADCGTRFLVRFKDVPGGIRLFVSERNLQGNDSRFKAGAARLVAADVCGITDGRYPVPQASAIIEGMPAVELQHDLVSWAIWELMERGPGLVDAPEEICFGIAVAAGPGEAGLGSCTVSCDLAPLTTVTTASPDDPVPRFIESYGVYKDAFTIDP